MYIAYDSGSTRTRCVHCARVGVQAGTPRTGGNERPLRDDRCSGENDNNRFKFHFPREERKIAGNVRVAFNVFFVTSVVGLHEGKL